MEPPPEVFTVTKLSIPLLVGCFIAYIILHVLIGFLYKKKLAAFQVRTDVTTPEYIEEARAVKYFMYAFKWFPFVYALLVIAFLLV